MELSQKSHLQTDAGPLYIVGQVKWFDFTKGYGFLCSRDTGDVLLHHKCLRRSGFTHVAEGATVRCEVVKGPSGLQASRVLAVDNSSVPSKDFAVAPAQLDAPSAFVKEGTVKWFDRPFFYERARRIQLGRRNSKIFGRDAGIVDCQNAACLKAAGALHHFTADRGAFRNMGEPRPAQALVMQQNIAGIARAEEAISFGEIKPFHLADNIKRPGIGLQVAFLAQLHSLQIPAICPFQWAIRQNLMVRFSSILTLKTALMSDTYRQTMALS